MSRMPGRVRDCATDAWTQTSDLSVESSQDACESSALTGSKCFGIGSVYGWIQRRMLLMRVANNSRQSVNVVSMVQKGVSSICRMLAVSKNGKYKIQQHR